MACTGAIHGVLYRAQFTSSVVGDTESATRDIRRNICNAEHGRGSTVGCGRGEAPQRAAGSIERSDACT